MNKQLDFIQDVLPQLPSVDKEIFEILQQSYMHEIKVYDQDNKGKQHLREVNYAVCRPTAAVLIQNYINQNYTKK